MTEITILPFGVVGPSDKPWAKFSGRIYQMWLADEIGKGEPILTRTYFGYDPQKLLPAPDKRRTMRERLQVWSEYGDLEAHGLKVPERPTVNEWAEQYSPLDGIDAFRDYVMNDTGRLEPLVVTDTMHDAIQTALLAAGIETNIQMVTYMHAAFVHESDLGDRTPRGRIELFDYDDHTVITLEGSGELPGRRDIVDDLFSGQFARQMSKTASMTAMMRKLEKRPAPQKSYLDHDPTKRHKRRKQRGNPHKR